MTSFRPDFIYTGGGDPPPFMHRPGTQDRTTQPTQPFGIVPPLSPPLSTNMMGAATSAPLRPERKQTKEATKGAAHPLGTRLSASVQQHFVPVRAVSHDVLCLAPITTGGVRRSSRSAQQYCAIIEVGATNYTFKSPEEQDALIEAYRTLLRALRFPLQILVRAERMDLSSYLSVLRNQARRPDLPPMWHVLTGAHQRELQELGARRTLIERRYFLVIPATEEAAFSWAARLPFYGKRHRRKRLNQSLGKARQELSNRVAVLADHLSSMGLYWRRLSGKELVDVYHQSLCGDAARLRPLPDQLYRATGTTFHRIGRRTGNSAQSTVAPSSGPIISIGPPLQPDTVSIDIPAQPDLLSLADLIAPSCIIMNPDAMRVGDEYVRVLSIVGFPREVTDGYLTTLLRLDEVMDVVFHLHPRESGRMLRQLMFRKAQYAATQRANLRQGRQEDPELKIAEQDIDSLIGVLASGEERLLELSFYVLVRAPDRRTLSERSERVQGVLYNLLLSAHTATFEQAEAFRSCLPQGRDTLRRTITTTSTVVAASIPFVSDSFSMKNGLFVGVTPAGEPIMLDPWAIENPHEFWGGITGGGKSYGIKLQISHELTRYPGLQDVVIAPSREYVPLTEAAGGKVIRIAPGSVHCINPFDLRPVGMDLRRYVQHAQLSDRLADKVQKLHVLLDIMLSNYTPDPTTLSAREKAYLDRALYETYRRAGITEEASTHERTPPLMRDLYEVLRQEPEEVGPDEFQLADRLARFVEGSLAGIFNQATNVPLDGHLLDFDISEMGSSKEMRPIGMFLITEFLWTQAIYHPRPRRIYIDEAWLLIQHQEGGRFLEKLAREARKYFMSLITITQNPELFIADPHGSVIAQNAMTKVLKKLDTIGAQAVRTAFGLTKEEARQLTTLPQHRALLIVGNRRMLVDIHASPEEHTVITTNPVEQEHVHLDHLPDQESILPEAGEGVIVSAQDRIPDEQRQEKEEANPWYL